MSGRLIITGKKTYTPWNAKNRERVLRDERLERERIEKEEQRSRQGFMQERIKKMKKRMGIDHDAVDGASEDDLGRGNEVHQNSMGVAIRDGDQQSSPIIGVHGGQQHQQSEHINFFEKEEKEAFESVIAGSNRSHSAGETNPVQSKTTVGIVPVFLVGKRGKKEKCQTHPRRQNNEIEFYQRERILRKEVDDKLKDEMDPMSRFHNDKDSMKIAKNSVNHNENIIGPPAYDPVSKSDTYEAAGKNDNCDISSSLSSRRKRKKHSQRRCLKGKRGYKEPENHEIDKMTSIHRLDIKNESTGARLNVHRDCDASLSSSSSASCQKSMKRRRKERRNDNERRDREKKRHKRHKKHAQKVVDETKPESGALQKMKALRRRQMERNKNESLREHCLRKI